MRAYHVLTALTLILLCALTGAQTAPCQSGDPDFVCARDSQPAQGMLLIARRGMPDPRFHRSVVLITEHTADFTTGLIINRLTTVALNDVVPEFTARNPQGHRLYYGGPVAIDEIQFLLHSDEKVESATAVLSGVYVAGNPVLLKRSLNNGTPRNRLHVYHGYSGWGRGQLANELERGDWHLHPGTAEHIFTIESEELWRRLIERYDPGGVLVNAGMRQSGSTL